jgi:spore maturation protein CgeB
VWAYNQALVNLARRHRPQVVWIDKGTLVHVSSLQTIKREIGSVLVCYNTDDLAYNHHWRLHFAGIPLYDFFFHTNRFNIEELKTRGARQVVLAKMGYDRNLFKPYPLLEEEAKRLGAEVGFIGHWEPATEKLILELLDLGLALRVRGALWKKMRNKKRLSSVVETADVLLIEYVKAIISTKINLGINSAQNRNLSSARSFEIPASGGFLLAERTIEHEESYTEGKEAEYFNSAGELAEKARYFLSHDTERKRIAEAGHKRCISSGYSWQERMEELVRVVEKACS